MNESMVKGYFEQAGVDLCDFENYPKGSLSRGIGGIIESGVALVRKLIQGAIRNSVLEFQHFSSVIKQVVCYANKRPITDQSPLHEQNSNDEFVVITPEYLKFGYDTCVIEVEENENSDDEVTQSDLVRLTNVKDRLRDQYHGEFLYGLIDQATKYKDKYLPVRHQVIKPNDIVLVKDNFVKAANYPLAKVLSVTVNSLGEVTKAKLLKGNKAVIDRDISSLILLVKAAESANSPNSADSLLQVAETRESPRPQRKAAVECAGKLKALAGCML